MTEELKKALYECFLKDTPIKYEDVTDKQFDDMSNSFRGAFIKLGIASKGLSMAFTKAFGIKKDD